MVPEGWSPSTQNPESATGNLIREFYKFHIFITFHFEYLVKSVLSICICFDIVQAILICKLNIISSEYNCDDHWYNPANIISLG